jgi:hypothetical protein
MSRTLLGFALVVCLAGGVAFWATGCGSTPQATAKALAMLEKIEKGEVQVKRLGTSDFAAIAEKDHLFAGDLLRTGPESEAVIRFGTGAVTRITAETEFELQERTLAQADQQAVYTRLVKGIGYFYVPKGKEGATKFYVETKQAVASIKGTTFKVEQAADTTTLTVAEGVVAFAPAGGQPVDVNAMQQASVGPSGLSGPSAANTLSDPYLSDAPPPTIIEGQGN